VNQYERVELSESESETHIPHIDAADAEHAGAVPDLCDLLGRGLGLLDAAADDAGVGAEVHQGPGLGAANGTGAASDEQDPVGWSGTASVGCSNAIHARLLWRFPVKYAPNMPSAQTLLRYADLGTDIV